MNRHLIPRHIVINERAKRLSTASSSISAQPMPIVIAPMTWLRAVFGFRMRTAAHTADASVRIRVRRPWARTDLHKMPGKGRSTGILAQCSEYNALFRCQPAACGGLISVALRVPLVILPSANCDCPGSNPTAEAITPRFHTGRRKRRRWILRPIVHQNPQKPGNWNRRGEPQPAASGTPSISAAV